MKQRTIQCRMCNSMFTSTWDKRRYLCSDECAKKSYLLKCRKFQAGLRLKDPEKCRVRARNGNTKLRYGLSYVQKQAIIDSVSGKCELCQDVKTKIVYDHDHSNGFPRAPICGHCNTILGYLESKPILLTNIINYLEKYSKEHKSFKTRQESIDNLLIKIGRQDLVRVYTPDKEQTVLEVKKEAL